VAHLIDTDPYKARKLYVKLGDKLLPDIPGPHLKVMATWPKWDQTKSPPPPGGLYLNPLYVPEPPKISQRPVAPVAEETTERLTLMEQPSQESIAEEQNLSLPAPENKQPLFLEGPKVHIVGPSDDVHNTGERLVPEISVEGINNKGSSPSVAGSLMIEAAPKSSGAQLETMLPVIATPVDRISDLLEEASSLNLSDDLAAIKGIRPDMQVSGEVPVNSAVESPAAIGKHFAIMAGKFFHEGANRRNWNSCW
jgi:hypothetical protein